MGADKGYFAANLLNEFVERKIKPHSAVLERAGQTIHRYVKKLTATRRFSRQGLERVRQEAFMKGWLLNLKRTAAPAETQKSR